MFTPLREDWCTYGEIRVANSDPWCKTQDDTYLCILSSKAGVD